MQISNILEVNTWLFEHQSEHVVGIKGYIEDSVLPVNIAWMSKDNPECKVYIHYKQQDVEEAI